MRSKIIPIGNSKGIRIPSAILKQCNIENQVELNVEKDKIIIEPVKSKPRKGWEEAFQLMHERGDDLPLVDEAVDAEMET